MSTSDVGPAEHLKGMAAHMLSAIAVIKPLPADEGTMVCPACGGSLRWKKVGPKKHVHAKCQTTAGCLVFSE